MPTKTKVAKISKLAIPAAKLLPMALRAQAKAEREIAKLKYKDEDVDIV